MEIQAMNSNTIIETINRMLGDIQPYGSTAIDNVRSRNLTIAIEVTEHLLYSIRNASHFKDRPEFSLKEMGTKANNFLLDLRTSLIEDDRLDGYIYERKETNEN